MKRTEAREEAFKLLYSIQLMEETNLEEQIDLFIQENNIDDNDAINYIKDIIIGVNQNNEKIEKDISENIKAEWDINRISKIDLTLLKLGIYEILYSKLPYKVVINEVVEIAKKYGDDNSKSFVSPFSIALNLFIALSFISFKSLLVVLVSKLISSILPSLSLLISKRSSSKKSSSIIVTSFKITLAILSVSTVA